jgi:hypothetical protein
MLRHPKPGTVAEIDRALSEIEAEIRIAPVVVEYIGRGQAEKESALEHPGRRLLWILSRGRDSQGRRGEQGRRAPPETVHRPPPSSRGTHSRKAQPGGSTLPQPRIRHTIGDPRVATNHKSET